MLYDGLGLIEIDIRMSIKSLQSDFVYIQSMYQSRIYCKPPTQPTTYKMYLFQLLNRIIASQLLSIAHYHTGNSTTYTRNLSQLGGINRIQSALS